jgi:hypothetical protein
MQEPALYTQGQLEKKKLKKARAREPFFIGIAKLPRHRE